MRDVRALPASSRSIQADCTNTGRPPRGISNLCNWLEEPAFVFECSDCRLECSVGNDRGNRVGVNSRVAKLPCRHLAIGSERLGGATARPGHRIAANSIAPVFRPGAVSIYRIVEGPSLFVPAGMLVFGGSRLQSVRG